MVPARLEKVCADSAQLAHIVPLSELEKGAPTGQTQPQGLTVCQTKWGPYLSPTHSLGCTLVQGTTSTAMCGTQSQYPSPDLIPNHQGMEAAPRCLA